MTFRLAVFGGGNMGGALVGGLLANGWATQEELVVVDVYEPTRDALQQLHPALTIVDSATKIDGADAALIAVKPYQVAELGVSLAALGVTRVLSVAAGITTAAMEAAIGGSVAVVRSMPNTPALVGAGAAAISAGAFAGEEDLAWAASILDAVGMSVTVPEHLLDAVTGLSGSGPAYLFLVAEALVEGGVLAGLTRPTARALVAQLFVGAGAMLKETGDEPALLRAAVTSPGGTTAAGLRELERGSVRSSLIEAVAAAAARSKELGL
jgi:pyrroline-5-carboxylate reductase